MRRALVAALLFAACTREPNATKAAAMATHQTVASKAEPGEAMPAYHVALLDGKLFDTTSEKGSVVLLNIWATWCGPCRFEIPELQALQQKYAGRGFTVVGVSVDDTGVSGVQQFIKENKVTYPIAVDADGRVATVLRTTVLPTTVIIGRDGRILWRKVGAVMPNETGLVEDIVERALAKKS
ncbi:MAG TPA: TlpA disulfide reductase family protein [Thermoanaerobaculia bacterium]|nr:TlpA disulfide reductase family protein [Thermoanaerobaculia bacterium]